MVQSILKIRFPRAVAATFVALGARCVLLGQGTVPPPVSPGSDPVTELEAFIVSESARVNEGNFLPTSRPFYSVYGEQSIVDVPRSVTAVTPEVLQLLSIDDFGDLGRIGPGTQQINYYGVPGTPSLRGARGGVMFNGVQRAFQRNEMPLSFGSLDAMDIVRGPAPAQYGAGLAGGYVNLIPKTPYFDRPRGSVRLEAGSFDSFRGQLDVGGPLLVGGRPTAYRVSVTAQDAGSYYDRIGNDYVSLYGALKSRLTPRLSLFSAGEYFRFRSNENAGWNRPTQALLDRGDYVIGEPLSIVSPAWGGVANRDLLRANPALVVPADVVAAAVDSARITAAQRDALLNLAEAGERATAYAALTPEQYASIIPTTSGYQYTDAYFNAGGTVFTDKVRGSTVLSDDHDFADSENVLYYLELENTADPARTFKAQLLFDAITTDKLSSYGYAISTRQRVIETKVTAHEVRPEWAGLDLTYGLSARYTDAKMLQDFSVEPFSRRDITRDDVSPNTVILAGSQRDPSGVNFWSPTAQGGANAHSRLWQFSAFATAVNKLGDSWRTYTSLLVTHAPYTTEYPPEVDRVSAGDARRDKVSDQRDYYSASFSPTWTVARNLNVYATVQYGTALDPLQGGAIVGQGNFARNRLQEIGVKTSQLDGRFFASVAGYRWLQSRFDERANNAELLEGEGVEFEFAWSPNATLTLLGSAGHQRVRRRDDLGFRSIPLTEQQIALRGGVLNSNFSPVDPAEGAGPYSRPATNPQLVYPGTPENQVKLHAVLRLGGGLGVSAGPVISAAYWHNFDRTLRAPSSVVWNGSVFYRAETWESALTFENFTNADYFLGAEPVFGANTLVTKAPGASTRWSVTWRF